MKKIHLIRFQLMLLTVFSLIAANSKLVLAYVIWGQTNNPPQVVTAVAPAFIPFVFGETGVAEVVVEAEIDSSGDVTSAKIVSASLFRDNSFEETAKRWRFNSTSDHEQKRIARIKFILRIMPKNTSPGELTTIYTTPYQIEVRHEVFSPQVTSAPIPDELKRIRPKKKRK